MEEADWMDSIDSVQYISASDPAFGPFVAVLLISALVFWIWHTDF